MEDTKLITKMELDEFLKMQEHIDELIEVKTIELAKILHNREPIGEICVTEIKESEFEAGCIHISYEKYSCGESWYDSYELPFEFLYNEKYPIHYKYLHGEKQRKLNKQLEMMRQEDIEREERELENYDRREFLRLKEKYGE